MFSCRPFTYLQSGRLFHVTRLLCSSETILFGGIVWFILFFFCHPPDLTLGCSGQQNAGSVVLRSSIMHHACLIWPFYSDFTPSWNTFWFDTAALSNNAGKPLKSTFLAIDYSRDSAWLCFEAFIRKLNKRHECFYASLLPLYSRRISSRIREPVGAN